MTYDLPIVVSILNWGKGWGASHHILVMIISNMIQKFPYQESDYSLILSGKIQ